MVDAAGTTAYTYTSGDQLLTEDGPFSSDTVTNTYLNRLRTSLVVQQPPGLWTNKFVYDAAGRLTNVASPAGVFGYTLGGSGLASPLIKKLLLPNTSYITNTFDSVARLTGTWLKTSGGTVLDSAVCGYNTASQRTTFTNAAGTYVGYVYDRIGQLKVADSSVNTEDRGYLYDAAWNLTQRTNGGAGSLALTVDSDNQLASDGTYTYSYDANGNLVAIYNGYPQVMGYTYDDENRLTGITYNDPGQPTSAWWQSLFNKNGGQFGASVPASHVSHLCFPQATTPGAGGLGCAALHEAAHSVGGVGDDSNPKARKYDSHAYDIAQCAGCPRPRGY